MKQQMLIATPKTLISYKIMHVLYDSNSCLTIQFSVNNITKFIIYNTLTIMVQFDSITCFKHGCVINQYRICYVSGKRDKWKKLGINQKLFVTIAYPAVYCINTNIALKMEQLFIGEKLHCKYTLMTTIGSILCDVLVIGTGAVDFSVL